MGRDEAVERHGPLQQQGGFVGHQRTDAQAPHAGQVSEAEMESLRWEGMHGFHVQDRSGRGGDGKLHCPVAKKVGREWRVDLKFAIRHAAFGG